jgi:hypothetical protein
VTAGVESAAVIRQEDNRAVIHCDRCPVRLDLGPAAIVAAHMRMPSGWVQDAPDHHFCPVCSRKVVSEMLEKGPPKGPAS